MVKVNMILLQFAHPTFSSPRETTSPVVTFLVYNASVLAGRSSAPMISNMEITSHIYLMNTQDVIGETEE